MEYRIEYGMIGEHFSDDLSKRIHEKLALMIHASADSVSYEAKNKRDKTEDPATKANVSEKMAGNYVMRELEPGEEAAFLQSAAFKGINVEGAFQESVFPYLDEISGSARRIGAVDTVVNRDGKLCGYNAAYLGMRDLLKESGNDPAGKKILILGTGRDAETASTVAADMGAAQIRISSGFRLRENTSDPCGAGAAGPASAADGMPEEGVRIPEEGVNPREQADRTCADVDLIINTTSCGRSPRLDDCPLRLESFTGLSGLVDLIYDPLRTSLVLEAQKRGISARGGLYMQVMKAVHAHELFTGAVIAPEISGRLYQDILNARRNIVLTGMSLAGKTTLGTLLSDLLGRRLEDTDQMIVLREGREITDIFATDGEPYFRDLETAMCRELAAEKGIIIATGGGAILRGENVDALKKNGFIVFLDRPLDQLMPASDRPLADTREKVVALMEKRYPIYRSTCDGSIANDAAPEDGAERILSLLKNPEKL